MVCMNIRTLEWIWMVWASCAIKCIINTLNVRICIGGGNSANPQIIDPYTCTMIATSNCLKVLPHRKSFYATNCYTDEPFGFNCELSSFLFIYFCHCLSMVEFRPSSSLSAGCVVSLRGDWAIFCHAGSGWVGGVWSVREKFFENTPPWVGI